MPLAKNLFALSSLVEGIEQDVAKKITKQLISIAQKHKLNFLLDVATGFWTDASTIHTVDSGIPSGGIFIPRFYSHSPVETANINDIKQTSTLVLEYLKLH